MHPFFPEDPSQVHPSQDALPFGDFLFFIKELMAVVSDFNSTNTEFKNTEMSHKQFLILMSQFRVHGP